MYPWVLVSNQVRVDEEALIATVVAFSWLVTMKQLGIVGDSMVQLMGLWCMVGL